MKKYFFPLLGIILAVGLLYLVKSFVVISIKELLLNIICAIGLFAFGVLMSRKEGRGSSMIREICIIVLGVVLFLIQYRYLKIAAVQQFLTHLGYTDLLFGMLYIYLGYIFL